MSGPGSVRPYVTVVVPARNEAAHIHACVRSILRQPVAGGLEVLVVDGSSEDGTPELAALAGARVLANPERVTPAALNRGLEAARGDVLVRFDAHSEMPEGYLAACLAALEEEDASNVGGWCAVEPRGPWGEALAFALASRMGVGNARLWRRPPLGTTRQEVDTVPFGCFRTSTLREIGGWSPDFHANQDFELNHRLRREGGTVVFDPAVWSVYRPRESFGAIARQYWRYGRWKAVALSRAPTSLRPRQLAPPALVAAALLSVVPSRISSAARASLAAYAAVIGLTAGRSSAGWRTPVVLVTMHAAWAGGLLAGIARPPVRRGGGARHARLSALRGPASP